MNLKKTFKIIVFIVLIGAGVYGYRYYTQSKTSSSQTVLTTIVATGSIENTIKTTGTSSLVDEQEMKFNQDGEVTAVYFKNGDTIKKGQIIAQLDNSSLLYSIQQAQISLTNSQIQLQQKLEPTDEVDIINAKNNISSTESNITLYKQQLENLYKEKENKIADIQKNITSKNDEINNQTKSLELLKTEYSVLVKQETKSLSDSSVDTSKTLDTAYVDAKQYLIDAENYLDDVDEIFGITESNRYKNDSFEDYLSVKNTSLRTSTEEKWNSIKVLINSYNSQISLIQKTSSSDVKEILLGLQTIYQNLIDLSKLASDSVNASTTSTTYTQTQIDSNKNSMIQIGTSSKNTLDKIKSSIVNVDKLNDPILLSSESENNIKNKENAIASAETNIKSLKADVESLNSSLSLTMRDYENNISQKQSSITNEENNLNLLKQKLVDLEEGPDEKEIQLAKNDIAKQQVSLASTRENLSKYQLEAPFDGIVRKIDFKVGDNILSTDEKYVYIENPNLVQITAEIDQVDIVSVQLGQTVRIVFDSYKTKEFTGTVSEKDSTPISSSGVTTYKIKITLDKGNDDIYSGMTAKLYIIIDSKSNILTVPSSFIETVGDKSYVTVQKGNKPERVEVVIGISDSTNTQIVSGVTVGDKLIRMVTVSTSSTSSSSNSKSQSGGGGEMGGPPPGM